MPIPAHSEADTTLPGTESVESSTFDDLFSMVFTGRWRDMHFHGWPDLSAFVRAKFTEGSHVRVERELASESEDHTSSGFGSPSSASKKVARNITRLLRRHEFCRAAKRCHGADDCSH